MFLCGFQCDRDRTSSKRALYPRTCQVSRGCGGGSIKCPSKDGATGLWIGDSSLSSVDPAQCESWEARGKTAGSVASSSSSSSLSLGPDRGAGDSVAPPPRGVVFASVSPGAQRCLLAVPEPVRLTLSVSHPHGYAVQTGCGQLLDKPGRHSPAKGLQGRPQALDACPAGTAPVATAWLHPAGLFLPCACHGAVPCRRPLGCSAPAPQSHLVLTPPPRMLWAQARQWLVQTSGELGVQVLWCLAWGGTAPSQ